MQAKLHVERLTEAHFLAMLLLAMLLHMAGLVLWSIMPRDPIASIPVRVLNIKIGGGDEEAPIVSQEDIVPARPNNTSLVESLLNRQLEREMEESKPAHPLRSDAPEQPIAELESQKGKKAHSTPVPEAEQMARQFVRQRALQTKVPAQQGSVLGTTTDSKAEMLSRYEQLISRWIQQYKVYPPEARQQGLQGEAIIRIRIDRQGNIRYFVLEKETGHVMLDRAVITMLKRANPVPPAPENYPAGTLLEFLVPVSFKLE